MDQVGQQLRRLRGSRSPAQMARLLGITETALRAYESGKRRPRDEVLNRIGGLPMQEQGKSEEEHPARGQANFFAQDEHK